MRSRVTPAVGSTMLIRRRASQLKMEDLPTLGRPTMATIGRGIAKIRTHDIVELDHSSRFRDMQQSDSLTRK